MATSPLLTKLARSGWVCMFRYSGHETSDLFALTMPLSDLQLVCKIIWLVSKSLPITFCTGWIKTVSLGKAVLTTILYSGMFVTVKIGSWYNTAHSSSNQLIPNHKIKTNIRTVFSYTESIAPTYVSALISHHQGVPKLVLILWFVIMMHGEYNVKKTTHTTFLNAFLIPGSS
jgi:hypothetical protein